MSISVLIADDHLLVRQGLKALLDREGFEVVAECSDGREAIRLASTTYPDVAIMDIGMPVLNGLAATEELSRSCPNTRSILLTRHDDDHYVIAALKAGVRGYVLKSQAALDLTQAIHEVHHGGFYLSPGVSKAVVDAFLSKVDVSEERLSPRERQVLQMISEGKTTKEVADTLGISVKTAESHRMRLMRKLDIHATAGLVRYAIRTGLIEP